MNQKDEKTWQKEFEAFLQSPEIPVPIEISHTILSTVRRALHPSAWFVFLKLVAVHAVVGTLSMSVCDQFGISPFKTGFTLSEYFMTFGHTTCMALCGVLFLSLSTAGAWLLLSREEYRVLAQHAGLQLFALSAASLAVFALAGAQITFGIGLVWLAGAMLGGYTSLTRLHRA